MKVKSGDVWLDIACNDGTMFKFMPDGVTKVGIDPCDDSYVAESSKVADHIVQDYFSYSAWQTTGVENKCKAITTIAMFYDLDNPDQFIQDIGHVLDDNGLWVIQLSYTPLMIEQLAFDNICHEHIYYYSLFNLNNLMNKNGFDIVEVELENGEIFAGGIHCSTLELVREDEYISYTK